MAIHHETWWTESCGAQHCIWNSKIRDGEISTEGCTSLPVCVTCFVSLLHCLSVLTWVVLTIFSSQFFSYVYLSCSFIFPPARADMFSVALVSTSRRSEALIPHHSMIVRLNRVVAVALVIAWKPFGALRSATRFPERHPLHVTMHATLMLTVACPVTVGAGFSVRQVGEVFHFRFDHEVNFVCC